MLLHPPRRLDNLAEMGCLFGIDTRFFCAKMPEICRSYAVEAVGSAYLGAFR